MEIDLNFSAYARSKHLWLYILKPKFVLENRKNLENHTRALHSLPLVQIGKSRKVDEKNYWFRRGFARMGCR